MAQVAISFDDVVSLPLPQLKQHLSDGNSQSLRELRAYIGLGSGGTKEENRCLIYEHIEKQRYLSAGLQPQAGFPVLICAAKPDPLPDPWKSKTEKKSPDAGTIVKDCKIKKPQFEKSRGNLDRVRKIAEEQTMETIIAQPAQPRWAARLLASPHRAGSSS